MKKDGGPEQMMAQICLFACVVLGCIAIMLAWKFSNS